MKFQVIKVLPILALLFLVACGADKNTNNNNNDVACAQVITSAYNPKTGETKDFSTPCDVPDGWKVGTPPVVHKYGSAGKHPVKTFVYKKMYRGSVRELSTLYYPEDFDTKKALPVIFFTPGWNSSSHGPYNALLSFITSQGYAVLFAIDEFGSTDGFTGRFETLINQVSINAKGNLPRLDSTKVGFLGHSSGGGNTFSMLKYFSDKGYGAEGRFVMALDPWIAYKLSDDDIKGFQNTNVVIIQFGNNGGKTDPRFPLKEYSLLDSIDKDNKDYQVVPNQNHGYASGKDKPYKDMQGVLKPLDALMDFTFNKVKSAHKAALEVGSDTPYKDGLQTIKAGTYQYHCGYATADEKIDYCDLDLESGGI